MPVSASPCPLFHNSGYEKCVGLVLLPYSGVYLPYSHVYLSYKRIYLPYSNIYLTHTNFHAKVGDALLESEH